MKNKHTHTPEPWEVVWLDDENGWVKDSRGNYLVEMVTKDEAGCCVSMCETTLNARRIVAAVNACRGIDTEALEKGVVKDLADACSALIDASLHWTGADEERNAFLKRARILAGLALAKLDGR